MIKLDHFNKTVERLLQAYQNHTLELRNAYTDVIGTLVAAASGYEIKLGSTPDLNDGKEMLVWMKDGKFLPYPNFGGGKVNGWIAPFLMHGDGSLAIRKDFLRGAALQQITATGYKPKEVLQILHAFRSHNAGDENDRIYYGLISVLDVLREIHLITDSRLMDNTISLFKTHYQKLCADYHPTQAVLSTAE